MDHVHSCQRGTLNRLMVVLRRDRYLDSDWQSRTIDMVSDAQDFKAEWTDLKYLNKLVETCRNDSTKHWTKPVDPIVPVEACVDNCWPKRPGRIQGATGEVYA
jgi:hypothetical protein